MNTIRFINTRQQACAAVLALSLTLGMLSSVNLLATRPMPDAQLAAAAAQAAAQAAAGTQVLNRSARTPGLTARIDRLSPTGPAAKRANSGIKLVTQ